MRRFNVLILCTGNSARSILAESIVNRLGSGRFTGFSAGSHPKGQVHPYAIDLLASFGYPTTELYSKSWDVFAVAGAPNMDFVFTVCDDAAGEACAVWPGQPMTAHWGIPDPAAEGGEIDRRAAFRAAFAALENRIRLFVSLPFDSLDGMALKRQLDAIGARTPSSAAA